VGLSTAPKLVAAAVPVSGRNVMKVVVTSGRVRTSLLNEVLHAA
jgi:hypothetical protein